MIVISESWRQRELKALRARIDLYNGKAQVMRTQLAREFFTQEADALDWNLRQLQQGNHPQILNRMLTRPKDGDWSET